MSKADEDALATMPGKPASVTITTPVPGVEYESFGPIERNVAALVIVDEESHRAALELGKRLKGMKSFVLELFKDPKKKAHDLHKSITFNESKYIQPIDKTLSFLNAKITDWEEKETRRAEQEARERQKEADRIQQERTLLEAVAAEEAGDVDLAEAIVSAPVTAPTVIAAPHLAEVAGASSRTTWSAEVVDLQALVNFVSKNPDSINLLEANTTALNGLARALKENMRIPGVRSVPNVVRSYREI